MRNNSGVPAVADRPRAVRIWATAGLFAISSCLHAPLLAQSSSPDFEAPVIEHFVSDEPTEGARQVFTAIVTDNVGVEEVLLFHRPAGATAYTTVPMEPMTDGLIHEAIVEIDEASTEAIEYYIEAEDAVGNGTLRGFAFDPLVRIIAKPALPEPSVPPVAEAPPVDDVPPTRTPVPEPTPDVVEPERKSNIWWYVAGALALGAIAAAASGGGSGDDGGGDSGTPPADPGCCGVTLTFAEP